MYSASDMHFVVQDADDNDHPFTVEIDTDDGVNRINISPAEDSASTHNITFTMSFLNWGQLVGFVRQLEAKMAEVVYP